MTTCSPAYKIVAGKPTTSAALLRELIDIMPNSDRASGASGASAASIAGNVMRQIANRIPNLRKQGARISEQDTKRVLITPALEALGWDIYDTEEVRNEYRHKSADNPVDYALFLNRSPVLFVEAKPLGQSLDDRKWILQTINYANAAGVDWCVLTTGAEYRLIKFTDRSRRTKSFSQPYRLTPHQTLKEPLEFSAYSAARICAPVPSMIFGRPGMSTGK
jgi:hypothetical protein